MFDAKSAAKVANEAKQNKQLAIEYADQCVLATILEKIEKAANNGDTQLYYECDSELSLGVWYKLKNLKYEVSRFRKFDFTLGGYYYIKWNHL